MSLIDLVDDCKNSTSYRVLGSLWLWPLHYLSNCLISQWGRYPRGHWTAFFINVTLGQFQSGGGSVHAISNNCDRDKPSYAVCLISNEPTIAVSTSVPISQPRQTAASSTGYTCVFHNWISCLGKTFRQLEVIQATFELCVIQQPIANSTSVCALRPKPTALIW